MATSVKQVHVLDSHAKLSKKVAELTVVVHMLFKRNHEKEVEYEFFKMMAEKELNKIKEEHRKKIEWLEKQLDEQEAYRAKVEYQLGDLKGLEERIRQLEQENEDTLHQVLAKEELLHVANLEIDVLKQKVQAYAENASIMNTKPEETPPNVPLLVPAPVEQERISKSATQLHLPPIVNENQVKDLEAIIKGLEDEMTKLRNKHEKELSKSLSEKVMLQKKIDSYTSSLSQEIDELKQTLNTLSSKQMVEQRKIAEIDKEKRRLEDSLKKSEADKKQLQRDLKILRDQLKNAVKSSQLKKQNVMDFRNATSQSSQKQRLIESVSKSNSVLILVSRILLLKIMLLLPLVLVYHSKNV